MRGLITRSGSAQALLPADDDAPSNDAEQERCVEPKFSNTSAPLESQQLPTPASTTSELGQASSKPRLLYGAERSQMIDSTLWTAMPEDFHDPEDTFEDSSSPENDSEASSDDCGFVLGQTSKSKGKPVHPSTEHVLQLWQLFVTNVDPLTKVVHVPTLNQALQKATSDIGNVPRNFEALMFAIYSAAIMSIRDDECRRKFGRSRKYLLRHYTSATKVALARAKFMGTTSLVVLQALILHLLAVREICQPRTLWTLTGVAVRLAEAMGLHRDGTSLGLPPFETEIRRRIWWQLNMNDARTAELSGTAKFRGFDGEFVTSQPPVNVDDTELSPDMLANPVASKKATDMSFCCARIELARFAVLQAAKAQKEGVSGFLWDNITSMDDIEQRERFIEDIQETLETKYLRYCDPSQPLQLMTMLLGRSAMNISRFIAHHPRRWASLSETPESQRRLVWDISIKLLEQYEMLQTHPKLQRFAWYAVYFMHWYALIHVLGILRFNPLTDGAEEAWKLIASVYETSSDAISNMNKSIHRAVGSLCLEGFDARQVALSKAGQQIAPVPAFIVKLRTKREEAIAKSRARTAKRKQPVPMANDDQHPSRARASNTDLQTGHHQSDEYRQELPVPSTALGETIGPGDADEPWLAYGFDDSLLGFGTSNDNSNDIFDIDTILATDHGFGDISSDAPMIDWTQWDAWLSGST